MTTANDSPARRTGAEYQAERRKLAATIYFRSPEEKARFEKLAESAGYADDFSGWIVLQLGHATSGQLYPPKYVDELRARLDREEARHQAARDEAEEYRTRIKHLEGEHRAALAVLAGFPGGADILRSRFLTAQPTQGAKA